MSEEKKNPALEEGLETLNDDSLGEVSGGLNMTPIIRPRTTTSRDEPGIPGLPSENDEYDSAKNRLGVKR